MIELGMPSPLLAAWLETARIRLPWILLGSGVAVLWLSLLILMMSRWGQARPLSKCVALSVLAHLLLLGYAAYLTIPGPPQIVGPTGSAVRVQLLTNPETETPPISPSNWRPAPDSPHELSEENLPDPEQWESPTPVERAPDTPPLAAEEMAQLVDDLPPSTPEPLPVEPSPTLSEPLPSVGPVPLAASDPRRRPPEEPEITQPPPAPPRSAPPMPLADMTSPPERTIKETDHPIEGLALLPNHSGPSGFVPATEDPAIAAGLPSGTAASGTPATATGRLPSRTVSLATRRSVAAEAVPPMYQGRLDEQRQQLVVEQGGSAATEEAVEAALAWLARAQDPDDGHWDTQAWEGGRDSRDFAAHTDSLGGVQADTATTGLALLAFLAAGHTHQHGDYQPQVRQGLEFLRKSQSPSTGSLAGGAGRYVAMYCHGIATLALSEAYIMTRDEALRAALERAVHYTVVTQHSVTGGWRYQPGDQGDMSQFGWQLMALVSARSAGISIPNQAWQGAHRWLQRVSLGNHGGLACYTTDRRVPSHSMTAEALACRFFLQGGAERATVDEAANFIAREGLGPGPLNLYYCYYATMALYQVQDHRWVAWNRTLTARLLETQQTRGRLAGSWNPDTVWGHTGGRVYSTALACLCLETYYRFLPLLDPVGSTAHVTPARR